MPSVRDRYVNNRVRYAVNPITGNPRALPSPAANPQPNYDLTKIKASRDPLGSQGVYARNANNIYEYNLSQHASRLQRYATPNRNAILGASPELAAVSNYLNNRFQNPIPNELQDAYREQLRTAQAARGFGGGGTGVTSEEARYLFGAAEQQRMQLLPQMANFGQQILGMSGLGAPLQSPTAAELQQLDIGAYNAHTSRKSAKSQERMGYVNAALGAVSAIGGGALGFAGNYIQGQNQAQFNNRYLNLYEQSLNTYS